jgi:DNA topoisomerase-1
VNVETIDLPDVETGQEVPIDEIEKIDKETQPPRRYTQSSLVNELEKRGLGTKATRANIVESLYNRKYIDGGSIEVTDLGMAVVEALEGHCPQILSEELTQAFEKQMQKIREHESSREDVLDAARNKLQEILEKFQEDEETIGEELIEAVDKTRKQERQLGPCDQCEDGILRIIKKNGKFVGCNNYPDCENTYPLPGNGKIESEDELCDECNTPRIKVIRKGRKPYTMCIDPDCPTKDDW